MPELPDVETFRRYFDSTALWQEIASVDILARDMLRATTGAQLKRALEGDRFSSTRRHGKYLFACLENGPWLVLHFGMTGFLKYIKNSGEETRHARLRIVFTNTHKLLFDCQRKLGNIGLAGNVEDFVSEKGLGPDPLSPDFDLDTFKAALEGRTRMIKPALMDQKKIAGIGNIYSDEILFQAGIHPKAKLDRLGKKDIENIYRTMTQKVLPQAVEVQADPERLPGDFLIPHRRGDGRCPKGCSGELTKVKVSGRTSYVCPSCQPS